MTHQQIYGHVVVNSYLSVGMIYELLTGNLLFAPKKGAEEERNIDHMNLISNLLGRCPSRYTTSGKKSNLIFNSKVTFLTRILGRIQTKHCKQAFVYSR